MLIYDKRAVDGHEFDSAKYDGFVAPAFSALRYLPPSVLESMADDMGRDLELLGGLMATDIMSIDITSVGIVPTPDLISELAPVARQIYDLIRPTYNNLTVLSYGRYRQGILAIEELQAVGLYDMAAKFLSIKGFMISDKQRRFHQTIQDISEARVAAIHTARAEIEAEIDQQEARDRCTKLE